MRTRSFRSLALLTPLAIAVPGLATAMTQDLPVVERSTIWTATVQRGDLTRQLRGPGVLERFGDGMHAHVRIAQSQAREVVLGQAATVNLRDGMVSGTVVHIHDRVEQGTLRVVVEIDETLPAGVRPGTSVDARIDVELLEDVVYVDRPAFAQPRTESGIFKLAEGGGLTADRVVVRWGSSSVDKIVVAEGLEVGDGIILSDMSRYDGVGRVRIR